MLQAMNAYLTRMVLLVVAVFFTLAVAAQVNSSDSMKVMYPEGGTVILAPSARHNRPAPADSRTQDSAAVAREKYWNDSLDNAAQLLDTSTPLTMKRKDNKRDWTTWRPNAKRALWLALVIPGGGQIYNRKYWKLPIFYGGFVGCIYAITWNNQMYHDYAQAYMDIMDNNPETKSYEQFLHFGNQVTDENRTRYQELFRKRKNRFRRWRDLASFVTIAVYAVSVIDAYVDASLSDFDISPDLSLHIAPRVMNDGTSANPLQSSAIGLGVGLRF